MQLVAHAENFNKPKPALAVTQSIHNYPEWGIFVYRGKHGFLGFFQILTSDGA